MRRGSKENFILLVLLLAAVLLVVGAAILIGVFFVPSRPHLAVGLAEGAVVVGRRARPLGRACLAQAGDSKKEIAAVPPKV